MYIPAIQQSNTTNFSGKTPVTTKTALKHARKFQKSMDVFEEQALELTESVAKKPLSIGTNIVLMGKTLKAGFKSYLAFIGK